MIVIGEFGRDRMEFCRFVPKTPQVSENNPLNRPALTVNQILTLADAFFKSHGHWPYRDSGAIDELPGETWKTINKALQRGSRGLPAGKTLAGLLNQHRGIFVGRPRRLPRIPESKRLRLEQIFAWGMVAAAFGYLPPVAGAVLQEAIDVVAVLNATRVAWPPRDLTDYKRPYQRSGCCRRYRSLSRNHKSDLTGRSHRRSHWFRTPASTGHFFGRFVRVALLAKVAE